MRATTADELMARIVSFESGAFPKKEQLHAALAPWKNRLDETALLVLAAALRKGDRTRARLVAEAFGWLAGLAAAPLLVPIMVDESAPLHQRAAAAVALQEYAPEVRRTLSGEERAALVELPVREMVSEAGDDSFAAEAIRSAYLGTQLDDRPGFAQALAHLAGPDTGRAATVLGHLLAVEDDPPRRRTLIALIGTHPCQEAADVLASLAANGPHPEESNVARRLLDVLHGQGVVGAIAMGWRETDCFVTGADGDSCFALTFVIPHSPSFTLAHFLISLVDGIRDAMVRSPASKREAEQFVARERELMTPLSAVPSLDVAVAMVQEARQRTRPGRLAEEPDIESALRALEPVLTGIAPAPPERLRRRRLAAGAIRDLLISPGFEYWYLESGEEVMRPAMAIMTKPSRARTAAGLRKEMTRRLDRVVPAMVENMLATGEAERLVTMLVHQARVLHASGDEKRAKICLGAAAATKAGDTEFVVHLAMRSLLIAAQANDAGSTPAVSLEGRESLVRRIEESTARISRRQVAELDLATEMYQAINAANRAAPSARRSSLTAIEHAAVDFARHFLDWLDQRAAAGEPSEREVLELVTDLRQLLTERDAVDRAYRLDAAGESAAAALNFVERHCRGDCPHRCLDRGDEDGRLLFFSKPPLWQVGTESVRAAINVDPSRRPQA
jgi:hypothetical protein